jgi:hypothetical protein
MIILFAHEPAGVGILGFLGIPSESSSPKQLINPFPFLQFGFKRLDDGVVSSADRHKPDGK